MNEGSSDRNRGSVSDSEPIFMPLEPLKPLERMPTPSLLNVKDFFD